MDIKKLTIEIELLRIIKPIAHKSLLAVEEMAMRLKEIHRINEVTPSEEWKEFQKETYEYLKKIKKNSDKFEEKKHKLIQEINLTDKRIELDDKTKVEFDKLANVVKVYREGSTTEII